MGLLLTVLQSLRLTVMLLLLTALQPLWLTGMLLLIHLSQPMVDRPFLLLKVLLRPRSLLRRLLLPGQPLQLQPILGALRLLLLLRHLPTAPKLILGARSLLRMVHQLLPHTALLLHKDLLLHLLLSPSAPLQPHLVLGFYLHRPMVSHRQDIMPQTKSMLLLRKHLHPILALLLKPLQNLVLLRNLLHQPWTLLSLQCLV